MGIQSIYNPEKGKEIILINKQSNNIIIPHEIEIISNKDSKTGKEILINKNTGNELSNIKKKFIEKLEKVF